METITKVEFRGQTFETWHGSPFDRGSADSYYNRGENPHWYPNGTGHSPRIESADMSMQQLREYFAGYAYNEEFGDKKNWD